MVSHKLAAGFGSSVEVDTILTEPEVTPGGTLTGEIHFRGGKTDYNIQTLTLEFLATLEAESGNPLYPLTIPYGQALVAQEVRLVAESRQVAPFSLPVPWMTPINTVDGRRLRGVSLGIHTGMRLGGTFNKSDSDPLEVTPLPAQETLLRTLERMRFTLKATDLEDIRLAGADTSFVQKIKYWASEDYTASFHEIKVTLLTSPDGTNVILEGDNGATSQFHLAHTGVDAQVAEQALADHLHVLTRV